MGQYLGHVFKRATDQAHALAIARRSSVADTSAGRSKIAQPAKTAPPISPTTAPATGNVQAASASRAPSGAETGSRVQKARPALRSVVMPPMQSKSLSLRMPFPNLR